MIMAMTMLIKKGKNPTISGYAYSLSESTTLSKQFCYTCILLTVLQASPQCSSKSDNEVICETPPLTLRSVNNVTGNTSLEGVLSRERLFRDNMNYLANAVPKFRVKVLKDPALYGIASPNGIISWHVNIPVHQKQLILKVNITDLYMPRADGFFLFLFVFFSCFRNVKSDIKQRWKSTTTITSKKKINRLRFYFYKAHLRMIDSGSFIKNSVSRLWFNKTCIKWLWLGKLVQIR